MVTNLMFSIHKPVLLYQKSFYFNKSFLYSIDGDP